MTKVESSVHASAWSSWVYPPGKLQWCSTRGGWFCSPERVINGLCGLVLSRLWGILWAESQVKGLAHTRLAFRGLSCLKASVTLYL